MTQCADVRLSSRAAVEVFVSITISQMRGHRSLMKVVLACQLLHVFGRVLLVYMFS